MYVWSREEFELYWAATQRRWGRNLSDLCTCFNMAMHAKVTKLKTYHKEKREIGLLIDEVMGVINPSQATNFILASKGMKFKSKKKRGDPPPVRKGK